MGAGTVIMDIGSKYTKLCIAAKSKDKVKLSEPTFVESPADYVIRDKGYQQRLQLKLSEMKVKHKDLRVILNRDNINVIVGEETIQLTKGLSDKAIRNGIQNKILNGISDKNIVLTDWCIIAQTESSITFEYAIIKKDIVDMLQKIAEENKLHIVSIDVRMSAVLGFYKFMKEKGKFAEQGEDEINCLLYIGNKNYNLVCFSNEGIIYTKAESNDLTTLDSDLLMAKEGKTVDVGAGVGFNADGSFSFAEETETDETAASFTRKEQLGFRFDEETVDSYSDYKRRIDNGLVVKVSRQLDKAQYKGKRVGIKNMYLIGSSSKLPHIAEYFKDNLGADLVEVVDMNEYVNYDTAVKVENCEGLPILLETFAISVGNIKEG